MLYIQPCYMHTNIITNALNARYLPYSINVNGIITCKNSVQALHALNWAGIPTAPLTKYKRGYMLMP